MKVMKRDYKSVRDYDARTVECMRLASKLNLWVWTANGYWYSRLTLSDKRDEGAGYAIAQTVAGVSPNPFLPAAHETRMEAIHTRMELYERQRRLMNRSLTVK